ncbi:MAG: prepilin-type N-terminal cleavage/methylation domain-containing protein [Verrucomicrobiota bacterium]
MMLSSRKSKVEGRAPVRGATDLSCPRLSTLDPRHGFTLIELILVLTLLAVATSLIAPSLSSFFRGRAIDSEARQLLALAHAGQSRAIADGFPVLLWIDASRNSYGLEQESSDSKAGGAPDGKAESFDFENQLRIDTGNASPLPVNGRSLPAIRFMPDGTIDENSATSLHLLAASGESLWLIQSTNRLGYEIRSTDR